MKLPDNVLPPAPFREALPRPARRDFLKAGLTCALAARLLAAVALEPKTSQRLSSASIPAASYIAGSAKRLSQVTGDGDPTHLPHLNSTSRWGLTGTDMGCPVEYKGRLYLLFGDVPTTTPVDLDPICYTTDRTIDSGNLRLSCIREASGQFSPMTIDGKSMGTNQTATGAFAYHDRIYAFVVRGNSRPYSTLVSTPDPAKSTDFHTHYDLSDWHDRFWQVAPWVVRNRAVRGLPSASGDGLLMWGQSGNNVYLAWMPLPAGLNSSQAIRFHSRSGAWTQDQSQAAPLFTTAGVTQLSATWLSGPRKWICLYTRAAPNNPGEGIVARIADVPWTWSDEVLLFHPDREMAWGQYMHKPGSDSLHTLPPPRPRAMSGYAYSPFLLNRFTRWNPVTRHLLLTYLMATFVPYQTMLMQATVELAS